MNSDEAYLMGDWYALFRELNYYGLCRMTSILEDVKREKFVQEHKFKLPLGDKRGKNPANHYFAILS